MGDKSRSRKREVVPWRWLLWLVPSLLALVTFAAFLPTLHNQFVNWDDPKTLLDNPHYRGFGWSQLRWMVTAFYMGHYIPLTWMTFGLDYLLWGMKPFGYHLTSLILHSASAVVFYFLARRLLGLALPGLAEQRQAGLALSAGVASLLFALHPLRVESVAWATERRDVLSGLFYLLTILVYLQACERGERGRGWYWGSVGLFAAALLSKSMAVSLPVVLLILDVYPLRRLGGSVGWWGEPARRIYLEKIPFVLLALATSAIAFLALFQIHNMAPLDQLSVPGRLAISAYGLGFYLWKTVVPVNLSPLNELGFVNPWAPPFLLSYGVVLALTALALALRRRLPALPAAWLAYVAILLPVLGIFQNGPQIVADRYTYLACLGWAILAGAGLLSWWRIKPFLVSGLAVCVLLALGTLTWKQVQIWHDSERLWTRTLAIDPKSTYALNNLGMALAEQGRWTEAIARYQQALRIKPDLADAHGNWGVALAEQGRWAEAIAHYQQALRIKPNYANAHSNWGVALAEEGRWTEATAHYQQALRIKPDYADAHNNWGVALARQGELAEAIAHYQRALRLKPDYADAHYNWGIALARQGELAEAIAHYQEALRSKPDYAKAHYNWGVALAEQGRWAEAVARYQQALRIKPDYADAHNDWGVALARQGELAEAIAHYQQALRIKPDYADAHYNWGIALARQGRLAEAIAHYQQALRTKPNYADAHNNWGVALAEQGRWAEAIAHYQQALRIKPDYANAHNNWGVALARQGEPAEAIKHYRQALRIDPDYTPARSNLVNTLRDLGRGNEAMEYAKNPLE